MYYDILFSLDVARMFNVTLSLVISIQNIIVFILQSFEFFQLYSKIKKVVKIISNVSIILFFVISKDLKKNINVIE
jgi:hypothetical protein